MAKAGELKFVITVDSKGAVKSVRGYNEEVEHTEKTTKKANKTLDRYSKNLKRGLKIAALAAAAAMAVAIKKTIDFNKEIALTATMMPGMVDEVNDLKRNVQDLSIQYGKSTIDMAKGSFLVISAFGAQAAQSKKLEITAKAAAAGNAETAASLSLLSAVVKGYGDTSDEAFQKASDLAFQTVKFGQTDFPALAASMGKVIPVAAAMGVKQEELFTGFATLTGVTGNAAEVSTQLSGILRAMIKPTDGMKSAIKELGFETAEQMIEQEGLIGSMRMLVANTDGTSESIGKLFRRAEALTAVFAITGGQAEVFDQKFEELKNSAGATDQAFREISDGVNKAGFSLEQAKQSFSVFTQRIADSTLQSDEFNDALQGMKRSFESKEFVAAIASITSTIAKFVAHLIEGIAAFAEWLQQASDSQERFASQAIQWEQSFDTIYNALRQAGLSFEEYNRITSEMASSKAIDELRVQQTDLNKELSRFEEILERDKKAGVNNRTVEILATETKAKLNEITAERNDLLLNQTFEIFKNSNALGVNSEIIDKARGILRGNLTTQKEVTKETKANTESLAKNSIELSEVENIANKYGVSLTSANAILQKQRPELAEIAKLQNDLGVSLEEATKTYGILNKLEKDRKENLRGTNTIIPETINKYIDLDASLESLIGSMEDYEKQSASTIDTIEGYDDSLKDMEESTRKAKKENELFDVEIQGVADTIFGFGDLINKIAIGMGEWQVAMESDQVQLVELKVGFAAFVNVAHSAISAVLQMSGAMENASKKTQAWGSVINDAFKGFTSGGFFGAVISVAGNMDKLADAMWGGGDALKRYHELLEQTTDSLSGIAGISELAAHNMARFLEEVEKGNYELNQFNDYLAATTGLMQEGQDINWGAPYGSTDWEEAEQGLADYYALLQDVAGSDPGAIGEAAKKGLSGLNDLLAGGAQGQMEFNDQVNLTMGVFEKLLKSGESIVSVLGMMGDSFDQLIATQQEGKFAGNELFTELAKFRTLIKDNEELVKSVEGFNTLLGATAELGEISQNQLSSFAREAGREFKKLTEAGFSENQALQMMAPSLKILEENALRYGHTLDKNTQSLIDQAREAGAFDEMADPMDTLLQVMMKIGEVLGADMSEFNNLGAAAAAGASEAADSFEEVDVAIQKIGDTALDTAGVMAKSMDIATESMTDNVMNLKNESLKAFNDMAADAAAASREMKGSFSGLGDNNNTITQPPVLPLNNNIPGFANGGSGVVPPGFSNDDFHIGLSSGEPFVVGGSNTTTNNRTDNMRITLMQEVTKEDTVDSIALKTIQALKEKRFGIDKEIKNAIGAS